jgi:SAM-dependent methyltransferase
MEWFSAWFNSPYYHILYKNRDFKEAEIFIDSLINKLRFNTHQRFLDLACGKGRHATYLNSKGFEVVGLDIAPESILEANKKANSTLSFAVHDMREPLPEQGKFDFILNLFTSFGYFENDIENVKTMQEIKNGLKQNGVLVLDFMNTDKVIKDLVANEVKIVDGITFNISRSVENGFIIKRINFSDHAQVYNFEERVGALMLEDFKHYFESAGMTIQAIYGNYALDNFDIANSPRMIFVVK